MTRQPRAGRFEDRQSYEPSSGGRKLLRSYSLCSVFEGIPELSVVMVEKNSFHLHAIIGIRVGHLRTYPSFFLRKAYGANRRKKRRGGSSRARLRSGPIVTGSPDEPEARSSIPLRSDRLSAEGRNVSLLSACQEIELADETTDDLEVRRLAWRESDRWTGRRLCRDPRKLELAMVQSAVTKRAPNSPSQPGRR